MKKILFTIAAIAIAATASAQVIIDANFEDGDLSKWKSWQEDRNVLSDENKGCDSKFAYSVRVGTFCDLQKIQPKTTYQVSFNIRNLWGKNPPFAVVAYYDPEAKKLVDLYKVDLPIGNKYEQVKFKFKTKLGGYHRLTIAPGPQSGGQFLIDNLVVEAVK